MASYERSLLQVIKHGKTGGEPRMEVSKDLEELLLTRGRHLSSKFTVTENYDTEGYENNKPKKRPKPVSKRPIVENTRRASKNLVKDGFINLKCRCGQKVKVLEEHGGKKCRCPECKVVINVPVVSG